MKLWSHKLPYSYSYSVVPIALEYKLLAKRRGLKIIRVSNAKKEEQQITKNIPVSRFRGFVGLWGGELQGVPFVYHSRQNYAAEKKLNVQIVGGKNIYSKKQKPWFVLVIFVSKKRY